MMNFYIFFICLIIGVTINSLREWKDFYKSYIKFRFMKFEKQNNMLIANQNTNEEFIIFDDWHFMVKPNKYLRFDVWALVDFHKLFWLYRFNKQSKRLITIKKGQ